MLNLTNKSKHHLTNELATHCEPTALATHLSSAHLLSEQMGWIATDPYEADGGFLFISYEKAVLQLFVLGGVGAGQFG